MISLLNEENDKIGMILVIKIINEKIYSFFYEKKNENKINNLNINGAWGSGKSTIVNNLENFYKKTYGEKDKIEWIVLNLWEYETIVNPYFKLINDILNKILDNDEIISKKLNKNYKIEKSVSTSWTIPFLKIFGAEIKFNAKMLQNDKNDLNKLIKETVAKINNFLNENNKKIIIIFDEIDRCIPDNQIKFLSYIKNIFLEISNIFFYF
ncbi:P-loop NTPase fold protein [Spiroplasma endosymbiont of Polydrusus pterygomalis]|uniref:P-loop NTPase fold protein n=1 Tax=Spiroplasma endosymbiont of Polydrusus pterygomalis TaxID=3139327 RepID=UPI003CCA6E6C